jgi:tetratricopeptide (TPR) repeat protein
MRTDASPHSFNALTAVTGIAGILLGVIVGFVLGAEQVRYATPVATVAAAAPAAALASEAEIQAYHDILAADPKNAKAAVQLANKLYDAGRFTEAIPHYQQALALQPEDVNVSTDLATALFYAGRVDEALAQLDRSLAIDPAHAQTWFNVGIVRRDGRQDAQGAVTAWTRLLEISPGYPDAARVRTLIAETQARPAK